MRPVNLIPKEDRAGATRPLRSGPLAYLVLGALAAALLGVTFLVTTGNEISERKSEVTQLERETKAAQAKSKTLAAYTQFHGVREQRLATVSSLADSRFDWVRVMRELSRVIPGDVWLTDLTGTANPSVSPDGGASISLRATIPGPALEIVGCASDQQAVAGFVQALKDIDGVTRVGVQGSAIGAGSTSSGSGAAGAATCQTRKFIAQFQLVVAFDAAPVTADSGEGEAAAPAPTSSAGAAESATTSASSEGG